MKGSNEFHHLNISDLHISPYKDVNDYIVELKEIISFIDRKRDEIDLITIAGDFFNSVYSANHKNIEIAVWFFSALETRSKAYGFVLVVIKGTKTHDDSQLNIFKSLVEDGRVMIIEDVKFYVIKDLIFRFIPEYYATDYEELRQKAFLNKAHVTVLHGAIEGAEWFLKEQKASTVKNSQIVKLDDLSFTNELYTVAGHLHNRNKISENIWYTGSFTSMTFKDAGEKKGFDYITIDIPSMTYQVQFIENKHARKFQIIDATEICKKNINQLKAYFNSLKFDTDEKKDIIRIDVDTTNYNDEQEKNLSFIMSSYKGRFKFKTKKNVVVSNKVKNNIIKDADFVLSPDISIFDKIAYDIKEEYSTDISIGRIKELLDCQEITGQTILGESKT